MKQALLVLLLGLSAIVSASENKRFFTVEFAFKVSGQTMPAGQYEMIARGNDQGGLQIVNHHTGQSIFLSPSERASVALNYRQRPGITFRCEQGFCEIAKVDSLQPGKAPLNSYLRVVLLSSKPSQVE